ncbi:hypothetical protein GCM10009425_46700 [Pseudomonas asuensis]|uniref:Uncharacterized protein n=1 Tax=Pseudomonas asuensis TaxID=1825787 RepID=A0ABQ2H4K7_9PSED|nr:hypothetical protein GCM10009425_46700 [Pseudomonas asuensis]
MWRTCFPIYALKRFLRASRPGAAQAYGEADNMQKQISCSVSFAAGRYVVSGSQRKSQLSAQA